jgi:hypothetical protein
MNTKLALLLLAVVAASVALVAAEASADNAQPITAGRVAH